MIAYNQQMGFIWKNKNINCYKKNIRCYHIDKYGYQEKFPASTHVGIKSTQATFFLQKNWYIFFKDSSDLPCTFQIRETMVKG